MLSPPFLAAVTVNDCRVEQIVPRKRQHRAGEDRVDTAIIQPSTKCPIDARDVQTKAFGLLEREQFPAVADHLRNIAFDKTAYQWSQYTQLSRAFKRNLRHLFCAAITSRTPPICSHRGA
jgi:hypothetical protein